MVPINMIIISSSSHTKTDGTTSGYKSAWCFDRPRSADGGGSYPPSVELKLNALLRTRGLSGHNTRCTTHRDHRTAEADEPVMHLIGAARSSQYSRIVPWVRPTQEARVEPAVRTDDGVESYYQLGSEIPPEGCPWCRSLPDALLSDDDRSSAGHFVTDPRQNQTHIPTRTGSTPKI
ncbi:hypothetical protein BO78DRAFT_418148 [Aspergillus sclerotiicarbonarius CBS 121057]|uniref:Uncharacterized protein n=1 Tax=Aspergillus sclerotiicarbonarius (strain CBS 121057 / IBT 28362) TaxID=1448318 RepID=A0A319EBY5_ASPSB|nr:hypothetical protein BO78DRAFT_418148 [Aspergillus sclerotiicarbonarius CBS 121057]